MLLVKLLLSDTMLYSLLKRYKLETLKNLCVEGILFSSWDSLAEDNHDTEVRSTEAGTQKIVQLCDKFCCVYTMSDTIPYVDNKRRKKVKFEAIQIDQKALVEIRK